METAFANKMSMTSTAKRGRIKALICYICQKEFNMKKIEGHLALCKKKWDAEQELKQPEMRLPHPQEPDGFHDTLLFEKNRNSMVDQSLASSYIPYFNTAFPPVRASIDNSRDHSIEHLRPGFDRSLEVSVLASKRGSFQRERGVREMETHEKSTSGQKQPSLHRDTSSNIKIEDGEDQQAEHQEDEALQPSAFDLLPVRGAMKSPTGILQEMNQTEIYQDLEEDKLEACPHCGRTFLSDRLEIHLRSCKSGKPLKKLNLRNYERYTKHQQKVSQPKQNKQGTVREQPREEAKQRSPVNEEPRVVMMSRAEELQQFVNHEIMVSSAENSNKKSRSHVEPSKAAIEEGKQATTQATGSKENRSKTVTGVLRMLGFSGSKTEKNARTSPDIENHQDAVSDSKRRRLPFTPTGGKMEARHSDHSLNSKHQSEERTHSRSDKPSEKPSEKTQRTGRTTLSTLKAAASQQECPYCLRTFNEKVAARHIPNCQYTKNRPRPPPSKEDILAKQDERRKSTKRNISVKKRVSIPRERLTSFYLQKQQELNESRREGSYDSTMRRTRNARSNRTTKRQPQRNGQSAASVKKQTPRAGDRGGSIASARKATVRNATLGVPSAKKQAAPFRPSFQRKESSTSGISVTRSLNADLSMSEPPSALYKTQIIERRKRVEDASNNADTSNVLGELMELKKITKRRAGTTAVRSVRKKSLADPSPAEADSEVENNPLNKTAPAFRQISLLERSKHFSRIQCPVCLRNFSIKASENHQKICKERALQMKKDKNKNTTMHTIGILNPLKSSQVERVHHHQKKFNSDIASVKGPAQKIEDTAELRMKAQQDRLQRFDSSQPTPPKYKSYAVRALQDYHSTTQMRTTKSREYLKRSYPDLAKVERTNKILSVTPKASNLSQINGTPSTGRKIKTSVIKEQLPGSAQQMKIGGGSSHLTASEKQHLSGQHQKVETDQVSLLSEIDENYPEENRRTPLSLEKQPNPSTMGVTVSQFSILPVEQKKSTLFKRTVPTSSSKSEMNLRSSTLIQERVLKTPLVQDPSQLSPRRRHLQPSALNTTDPTLKASAGDFDLVINKASEKDDDDSSSGWGRETSFQPMDPIKPIEEHSPRLRVRGEAKADRNSSFASLPDETEAIEHLDNLQPIPESPDKPSRNPGWFDKLKQW